MKNGDFPASYVSLPEGNFQRDILLTYPTFPLLHYDKSRRILHVAFWYVGNGGDGLQRWSGGDFNHPWKNPIIAYIWPNGIIFHQPTSFPEIRGFPLLFATIWGENSCEVARI